MSDYTTDHAQEGPKKGKNSFNLRINLFFFSTFIIFCVIIIRLAILQFVEGPTLTEKESSNIVKDVPLPPVRGTIYDASGVKLAYSTPTQSLYLTLMKDYSEKNGKKNRPEAEKMAEDLLEVFNEYGDPKGEKMTKQDIIDAMDLDYKKYSGYSPRRIKMDLSDKEIAYFSEHKSDFPGIAIEEESIRHYDPDTVAVQTIGYIRTFKGSKSLTKYKTIDEKQRSGDVQADPGLIYTEPEFVGYDGLELMYQDDLRGKNGYKKVPIDPRNMPEGVEEIVPPEKGHNIYSTINKEIQLQTEQAITDQLSWLHTHPVSGKLHPNATTGFAVAMEVKTGNIVAMASMPDYDTNVWQSGSISPDNWDKIQNIYQNGTIRSFNPGKSGSHPESVVLLGSTMKPLSVLIGLKEGLIRTNTYYNDTGAAYFGKEGHQTRVQNSQGHVYGGMDPARAIEKSSNAFMVDEIGKKLYEKYGSKAIEVWDSYMTTFGLGVSTGSGLPGEWEGRKEYLDIKAAGSTQAAMAYASFGQQGKYTTLQLAQYAAMLANEGKRLKPQLVSKITDDKGNILKTFKPEVLNTVNFNQSYWDEIKRGMKSDVSSFEGFPYSFARKTGTSTQSVGGKLIDNGVFIAFAPKENPVLAIAVMIPEGGFGSQSAAPIARKIFDAYDEVYGLDGVPKGKKETTDGQSNP
ncbi:cell division protein FtsI/penicillin-binding protein 2 [Paenibacillus rhizosphaerae]|uniref:Cell division protein FtsI/penicillin-binding protein 2 n=1 Tax=Paenibacillus rhizosphaerae TaxID=297318 RepID=A0A839U1J3_9BACL|nr:penicillin-binding transpeptidase domain-containing protein [Paenibacillus rhizosphaerae]MBB3131640.1 cell division protein FtsI/penicillin-binding protein 2 [Paenibacillus rhizosphaerae]